MGETSVLEFLIKAQNQANQVFDQARKSVFEFGGAVKTAAQGWTDLTFAFNAGMGVVNSVAGVVDGMIQKNMDYAKEVKDLARTMGDSAESASMLIQAGDDVQVSYQTIQSALEKARVNGILPTMESLEDLSDQYLAITDPIAQTGFVIDTFGRAAGPDLVPLLLLGKQGIKAMGEEAKQLGLTLDQVDLDKLEAFRQKQDNWNDKLEALTLRIGPPVIDFLSRAMDAQTILSTATDQSISILQKHNQEMAASTGTYVEYINEMRRAQGVAAAGVVTMDGYDGMMDVLDADIGILTVTEWNHAKAMEEIKKKYDEARGAAASFGLEIMNNLHTTRGLLSDRVGYGNYYTGAYNAPGQEPGRASGGPMWAGIPRWVGENGPEPFTPSMDGWIGNTPGGGGGGKVSIQLSFPSMFPPSNPAQLKEALRPATEELIRELKRNGQI